MISPLRVAQLIYYFHSGGLEQLSLRLAKSYLELGHESHVVAYKDGPMRQRFDDAGIITHIIPGPPRFSPLFVPRLAKFFVQQRFHLLHTHHIAPMLYGVPASRLAGIPVMHTTHSNEHLLAKQDLQLEGSTPTHRKTFQHLAQHCDHIVTVNQELKDYLQHELHLTKVPITAVPNGVDASQFHGNYDTSFLSQEINNPKQIPLIGVVARLEPEKGHRFLLEAMANLQTDAQLLVIGDGSEREKLTQQTQDLGLQNNVHFLGLRHDLPQLFSALDLMVLPSLREGLPLVILEAMASGVPIVATAVGSVPNVLEQSGVGKVVPPSDSAALTAAMDHLLQQPKLRQHMAQVGQQWVAQHYSQAHMVQQYLDILLACIQNKHTPLWLKPFHHLFVSMVQLFSDKTSHG